MAAQPLLVEDEDRAPHPFAWALPLVPVAASVFGMSALLYYKVQSGGEGQPSGILQGAVAGLYHGLGFVPSFMLCILGLSWSSIWFITGRLEMPWRRTLRILTAAIALGLLVNLGSTRNPDGGELGRFFVDRLVHAIGHLPSTILIVATAIAAMLLATDFFFIRYFESLGKASGHARGSVRRPEAATATDESAAGYAGGSATQGAAFAESEVGPAIEAWAAGAGTVVADPPLSAPALDDAAVTPEETLALDPPEPSGDATTPLGAAEGRGAAEPAVPPGGERGGWRSRLRIRLDDEPPVIAPESGSGETTHGGGLARSALSGDAPAPRASARGGDSWLTAEPESQEAEEPIAPPDADVHVVAAAPYESPLAPATGRTDEDPDTLVVIEAPEPRHHPKAAPWAEPPPPAAQHPVPHRPAEQRSPQQPEQPEQPNQPATEHLTSEPHATAAPPMAEQPYELPSQPPRQGSLFGDATTDPGLLEEATRLVASSRRANAAFLRNRLRVSYDDALTLLHALAERGVVELGPDGTQARVLIQAPGQE